HGGKFAIADRQRFLLPGNHIARNTGCGVPEEQGAGIGKSGRKSQNPKCKHQRNLKSGNWKNGPWSKQPAESDVKGEFGHQKCIAQKPGVVKYEECPMLCENCQEPGRRFCQ